jgi:hypothetical protein
MDTITLELTKDEALVFFEWLARNDAGKGLPGIEHEAERKALWILEGVLERVLVEPLRPNYTDLLAQARERLLAAAAR